VDIQLGITLESDGESFVIELLFQSPTDKPVTNQEVPWRADSNSTSQRSLFTLFPKVFYQNICSNASANSKERSPRVFVLKIIKNYPYIICPSSIIEAI